MRNLTLACVFGLSVFSASAAEAQSIQCGGEYVVSRGDTLQLITNRAYGPDRSYQFLYSANRDRVGRNPSLIEVGLALKVPCLDGAAASTAPTETVTKPASGAAALPPPTARKIRVVTASDWAPYLDQGQAQGGMLVEVLNTALSRVVAEDDYKIDFVNDWSAHLRPLISDVAYDFSLAWFRPDCSVADRLSEDSQFRCNNLDWSDPLFEQIIGYYTRSGDAEQPATHEDIFGEIICRPAGYSAFMMEAVNLVEPNVTRVSPDGPADCFELLVSGEADVVVLATTVADDAMAELDVFDQVVEQPQLAYVATLHAVTSINNPNKDDQLALINQGLEQMREDGKWFEIVQRHLVAHARKTARATN